MDADRRRRFIAAFNTKFKGDRAKFIDKTKYTKGRVTQLFDEKEAFGQRAAAEVARRMGLPADAFEHDGVPGGVSPRALDLARVYDRLNESEQARFWRLLDAAMDQGVRGDSLFGDNLGDTKGRRAK